MKTMIELFSGSKILSNTFKNHGYKVFTVDNNEKLEPDLCINILDFDISMLPEEFKKPFVVWASPPCTTFSVASLRFYWDNNKPKSYKTFIGLAIAKKTLEIIEELNPKFWFIENPVAMLRKQEFMSSLNKNTITYCKYGATTRKPTDIWNNVFSWVTKKRCNNGDNCHINANRGAKIGVQDPNLNNYERAKLPKELCLEILNVCEGTIKIKQTQLK